MNEAERAEGHLRAMRALMERATIYRALSAPTALFAGLLTALTSTGMIVWYNLTYGLTPRVFVGIWIVVLLLVGAFNTWSLRQGAAKRGEPFISPGMKFALKALFPGFLAGGGITVWHTLVIYEIAPLVFYWMVFYGLALLSTEEYAPRSIAVLGWCFLLAGLITAPIFYLQRAQFGAGVVDGALAMAATFGLFHLVYAAVTWPRKAAAGAPDGAEGA